MEWLNEAPEWDVNADGSRAHVRVGKRTDFWRKTHDGGTRDNGHFYYTRVMGDFTAQTWVAGKYAALYDQAGLMVRLDERTWMKCGIEFLDGVQMASTVVTHDWSDWSILPLANPIAIAVRVVRRGGTIEVSYSLDGEAFTPIRQAYLSEEPELMVGLMAAAPTGEGFEVTFEDYGVWP